MKVRLFAALSLPAEARAALAAWAHGAVGRDPAVRLVREESLHVTLVFLGGVEEHEAEAVSAAVAACARPVGVLSVVGAAWLPPRRPGVLVADLAEAPLPGSEGHEGAAGLALLHHALGSALAPWHEPETRPLRPHVTVARVRRGARPARRDVPAPPALAFSPSALVLYRSHTGRGGASYEVVASAPVA